MCNSYKKSSSIFKENISIDKLLDGSEKYWAHLPSSEDSKKPETLEEHIELVNSYCQNIIDAHHLDPVIDILIKDFLDEFYELNDCGNYLKKLFLDTVIYHDYGKINENFQVDKMKNTSFNKIKSSPISSRHSSLGGFIYLAQHFQEIQTSKFSQLEKTMLFSVTWYFSYSIFKHHGFQLHDDIEQSLCFLKDTETVNIAELKSFMQSYVRHYNFDIIPKLYDLIGTSKALNHPGFTKYQHSFSLYALCRLNFSLLTASDYLATHEYMNTSKIDDFGILSKKKIEEIVQFVKTSDFLDKAQSEENYNKDVYKKMQQPNYVPEKPTEISANNLNKLRQAMAVETIQNFRKKPNENLYYLEAPTGGGKTNLSLLTVLEILEANKGKINKVFYVFPFTTLITQSFKNVKNTFGLNDEDVVQLHSKAGFQEKFPEKEDDDYGNKKMNYIQHLFANFPFSLLTHIKFFDILKTNEKETNYLLHRLANSVVVIDEVQSYPPKHWDKIVYFIKKYAQSFNIKFIVMSATLPKIDKLKIGQDRKQDFTYLLPNSKKDYFQNPNFGARIVFDFELFEKKDLSLDQLKEKLLEESKKYALKEFGVIKPSNSVFTIIEFIFKKTASEFFQLFKSSEFFDEVFLLSGTILEPRRRYIINYLKDKSNRNKRVLLVTTQVVEAGVDIDMDIGFKDRSLIDSDEQLAGRINRNIKKQDCKLFLFKYDKAGFIYGKDERLKISRKLKPEEYRGILKNKDFDALYYDSVIGLRNKQNETPYLKKFNDYKNLVETLKFKSVKDNFKLIDQENISCFIPLNIPVIISKIGNDIDYTFTKSEWDFLMENGIEPIEGNKINGEAVFKLYINLIEQNESFINKKINHKILQGILSNFIFSIFASEKIKTEIVKFSDEERSDYGYKYIQDWNQFYDFEAGMNDEDFGAVETQFL
ncbi:CRISPR-associated endonuclease/helicase Cas3 [Psychroflexus halocasei]|uniref:CRISPR-associated endonuclease/helicase Cas3 n=1 Tax=Psychroflexus halocasei TaxID=908615 RepID=A0A1H4CIA1_9FLAO|nr:CRISPR-associated endonuclease/helicase Cas3 [Psychroflexus halocasei]